MIKNENEIKNYLQKEWDILVPDLNERSRRRWAGFQSSRLCRGGKALVRDITGLSYPTINRGLKEIESGDDIDRRRIRASGGGRKKLFKLYPTLKNELENILNGITRGDPECPLKWTSKSTHKLCEDLKNRGIKICQRSVCSLLSAMGYSLQGNRKILEGGNHPDRDMQFSFINNKVKKFQTNNFPVISVDTKKKELVGNYKNAGKEYSKKGLPTKVNVYDFIDKEKGKVSPYGVYDLDKNKGWVSVGISSDTAEFAVNSIRSWWNEIGENHYKKADALYINADGGGSNGYRVRLWKTELQKFANEIGKVIHVSHFPPGTSKWNKIEHKMFCFISKNWRGRPLIDTATVVNLIGSTKTKTGLKIKAKLDERIYKKGIKVLDKEMAKVNLKLEKFHGEWNYIISPN